MVASIRQYNKPWPCPKTGREEKFAVYLLAADDGKILDVKENGCEGMDGSNKCSSCRAHVLQLLYDLHLGHRL